MRARIPFGWLLFAGLLAGPSASAQPWGPASSAPPADGYVTTQYLSPGGLGSSGHPQSCPCPDCNGGDLMAQLVPDNHLLYDTNSQLDLLLRESLRGAWIRLEYLQASLGRDDGVPLGRPLADQPIVTRPFQITFTDADPDDGIPPQTGFALVPTTAGLDLNNMQGIRGSFGIPILNQGWVEARFWGLGEGGGSIHLPTLQGPTEQGILGNPPVTFIATTLTTDGVPGSRLILYDDSFFSRYTADLYSADVNFVYNFRVPDEGLATQPLIGYRHEEYGERLTFGGTFNNVSGYLDGFGILANPETNQIDSRARNFRNQLQLGVRHELRHRWLTLGAEPKVAFGSNLVRSRVAVQTVRDPGNIEQFPDPADGLNDPALTVTEDRALLFAPSFDLDLYARFNLTEWFKLRVGYTFVWMGRMGVSDASIRFNETTDVDDPSVTTADVVVDRDLRSRTVSAFTIGGEIILP